MQIRCAIRSIKKKFSMHRHKNYYLNNCRDDEAHNLVASGYNVSFSNKMCNTLLVKVGY